MTVNVQDNTTNQNIPTSVDPNSTQQKNDINLTQKTNEKPNNNIADVAAAASVNNGMDGEDPNWKAFREARKRDKEQREAAETRAREKEAEATALKAAMEAAFAKSSPQQNNSNYQDSYQQHEETEDERIEKKVQAAIASRDAAMAKERVIREQQALPERLKASFPDYYNVVNEETGAYLEYHHPELYRSILRQPENFETCSDIYHLVKKYVPNVAGVKKDSAKADANYNKPKSISTTGVTQPGEAMTSARLDEEKKAANWARMQKILKGVS
jgi:hypothetical protein